MTERPEGVGRRGRPGHDQRDVVRVAVDLFNRQGYDATSVGDVARELGLEEAVGAMPARSEKRSRVPVQG